MPNWIRTTIDITGDREVLEKIYSAVNDCLDMPEILEDGSTNSWVGHVFDSLGINTKKYAPDRTFWDEPRFNKKRSLVNYRNKCLGKNQMRRCTQTEVLRD